MKAALLLIAAASFGCSNVYGQNYTVYIDPGFSPEKQEEVVEAVDNWQNHVPDLTLTAVISDCSGEKDGIICIHSSIFGDRYVDGELSDLFGQTHYSKTSAEIWVDQNSIQNYSSKYPGKDVFLITAEHELGHAMGLVHANLQPQIMNPHMSNKVRGITCSDVNQWYSVRHEVAPYCE